LYLFPARGDAKLDEKLKIFLFFAIFHRDYGKFLVVIFPDTLFACRFGAVFSVV